MQRSGLLLLAARGGGVPDVAHFECLQFEHLLLAVLGLQQENALLQVEWELAKNTYIELRWPLLVLTLTSLVVSTSILS